MTNEIRINLKGLFASQNFVIVIILKRNAAVIDHGLEWMVVEHATCCWPTVALQWNKEVVSYWLYQACNNQLLIHTIIIKRLCY